VAKMRRQFTSGDMLAYGIAMCFVIAGLVTLASGDYQIGRTRLIRTPVAIAGSDRILFGFGLLGAGYVLARWLFRRPDAHRRWRVELQILAAFALAGYVAHRIGLAS
jgi:hypothetical protein